MLSSCILLSVWVRLPVPVAPSRPLACSGGSSVRDKLCDLSFCIYTCFRSRFMSMLSMLFYPYLAASATPSRSTPLSLRREEELLLRWLDKRRSTCGGVVPSCFKLEPLRWASISSAVRSNAFIGPLRWDELEDFLELRWPGVDCGLWGVLPWFMSGRVLAGPCSKVELAATCICSYICWFWRLVRYCMLRVLSELWEGGAWPTLSGRLTGSGPPRLLRLAADFATSPEWRLACDIGLLVVLFFILACI